MASEKSQVSFSPGDSGAFLLRNFRKKTPDTAWARSRAYARFMRVTVSHNRPKEEIMRSVDRSFDDLFKGPGFASIQIVSQHRHWAGSRLTFSFDAKAGFISTPIKGFVDVTDKDVTVDADLGLIERLFPASKAQEALASGVRRLLAAPSGSERK